MRKTLLFTAVVFLLAVAGTAAPQVSYSPFETGVAPAPRTKIDQLVFNKLKRIGVRPANLCSDAVFVRRAYLDVIGTLPSEEEAKTFLSNRDPKKRNKLIDHLLEREEYADYWAMKWGDLLRIKSEFPINLWPNAVQAYHRWIRASLHANMPFDDFARELLTSSGSNFRVPQVNFYRAVQSREPKAIAQAVALTFMGVRAEHWKNDRLSDLAVFFSQIGYKPTKEWKEEIVFFDAGKNTSGSEPGTPRRAVLPDGRPARISPDQDPRTVFAEWLVAPKNPWFARNIVNRIWAWLLGRGIIHEPDDIRPDNPPANPELLAFLEREFLASRFNLKQIYRLILNSQVYQLSAISRTDHSEAEANFAGYPLRRLDAEVLIDALNQVTGATEQYSSPIPEPFTFIPEDQRSIALGDGSITSHFLETFGRPARDTGQESERSNRPSASQRLHLLNSSHIQRKIDQSARLQALFQRKGGGREVANALYLTILSRYPTDEELKIVAAHIQSFAGNRRAAMVDIVWALFNSAEFLYRH